MPEAAQAPARRGRPAISLEDKLPREWVDAVAAMSVEDLKNEVAKVANDESVNQRNKEDDQQLAEAKAAHDDAGAQYKEASKENKNKVALLLRVLGDKGAL